MGLNHSSLGGRFDENMLSQGYGFLKPDNEKMHLEKLVHNLGERLNLSNLTYMLATIHPPMSIRLLNQVDT